MHSVRRKSTHSMGRKMSESFSYPTIYAPSPWHDFERLAELRDRHRQLHENARAAREAVKEAARSLGMLKTSAGTHPAAIEALNRPLEKLARLTVGELANLQISPRSIQLIQVGEKRLARLTLESEMLRVKVVQSNAFMAKVEVYAKEHNL